MRAVPVWVDAARSRRRRGRSHGDGADDQKGIPGRKLSPLQTALSRRLWELSEQFIARFGYSAAHTCILTPMNAGAGKPPDG
jgi:hypothetical protein